jgi:hypothetical protein
MARQTIFCNHYRAMSDHDTCAAGVAYSKFQGVKFEQRPCFARHGKPAPGGCELAQFPTAEEIAKEEAEMEKRFQGTMKAREAIVNHLGGPWKKGMAGSSGVIDCPVCGGKQTLRFSRAGYNGHIHAACATDKCVSWME